MALTEAADVIPASTEAPRVPSAPEQMFRCEFMACTLRGAVCVQRQDQLVKSRNVNQYKTQQKHQKAFKYSHCASGLCGQGNDVRRAIGDRVAAAPELKVQITGGYVRSDRSTAGAFAGGELLDPRFSGPADAVITAVDRAAGVITVQPIPETPVPKIPTEQRPHCTSCKTTPIRRDNATGLCKKCKKQKPELLEAAERQRPPEQRQQPRSPPALPFSFGFGPGPLPDPKSLPNDYLLQVVAEFRRRAREMYEAARALGFDPAGNTPPSVPAAALLQLQPVRNRR